MILDPGVLHRDPFAKYAVAFRRISTSNFASASSRRSRLFSASNSLTGRRRGSAADPPWASGATATDCARLRFQLPTVATGTPRRRAASWMPTASASLTASTLNSSVYCRFGSLLSRISILHTAQVSNFLAVREIEAGSCAFTSPSPLSSSAQAPFSLVRINRERWKLASLMSSAVSRRSSF